MCTKYIENGEEIKVKIGFGFALFWFVVIDMVCILVTKFDGTYLPIIVIGAVLVAFIVLWSDVLLSGFGFFYLIEKALRAIRKQKTNQP